MMFLKECKAILRSIIYAAFVVVVIIFYASQLGDFVNDMAIEKPLPDQESYGYKNAEIPELVMPNAAARLVLDLRENEFASYKTGLYRGVRLSDDKQQEIRTILNKITGLSESELYECYVNKSIAEGDQAAMEWRQVDYSDVIPVIVDYKTFKEYMVQVDQLIGGGSIYDAELLKNFASVPITYEESLAAYQEYLDQDQLSGAYARVFCDYMGLTAALFSVFVPVAYLLRDRRARVSELLYVRRISSVKMVLCRFVALVTMGILPYLIMSVIPTMQLMIYGAQNQITVDPFGFIKYIIAWILPTILSVTALAYLMTLLTETPAAIIVQFAWSLYGLFNSAYHLDGGSYGTEIMIRHNSMGNYRLMADDMTALVINRVSYCLIALLLLAVTIGIYHFKRRGMLDVSSYFRKMRRHGQEAV